PGRTAVGTCEPRAGCLLGRREALAAEEALADALERLGELRGDDPQLVGVALGELGEGLQVLVREQLAVGVTGMDGAEDRRDGLRLTLGAQHLGLRVTFGLEDR